MNNLTKKFVIMAVILGGFALFGQQDSTAAGSKTEETVNKQKENPRNELTISQKIDRAFTPLVEILDKLLFVDPFNLLGIYDDQVYDENGNPVYNEKGEPVKAPLRLIVLWLLAGGVFFTVYLKFIGLRGIRHAIDILRGKYTDKDSSGEVSPFQSVTTALSATV
jgi:AGCS family alanine or glycine:cation symporter